MKRFTHQAWYLGMVGGHGTYELIDLDSPTIGLRMSHDMGGSLLVR